MDLLDLLEGALEVTVPPPAPSVPQPHARKRCFAEMGAAPARKEPVLQERHPTAWALWLAEAYRPFMQKKHVDGPVRVRSFCSGMGTEAFALKELSIPAM